MTLPDVHLADEAVAAYVDHALAAGARQRAERHLGCCAECLALVEAQREAKVLLTAAPDPQPAAGLLARLRDIPMTADLGGSDIVLALDGEELGWARVPAAAGRAQAGRSESVPREPAGRCPEPAGASSPGAAEGTPAGDRDHFWSRRSPTPDPQSRAVVPDVRPAPDDAFDVSIRSDRVPAGRVPGRRVSVDDGERLPAAGFAAAGPATGELASPARPAGRPNGSPAGPGRSSGAASASVPLAGSSRPTSSGRGSTSGPAGREATRGERPSSYPSAGSRGRTQRRRRGLAGALAGIAFGVIASAASATSSGSALPSPSGGPAVSPPANQLVVERGGRSGVPLEAGTLQVTGGQRQATMLTVRRSGR